jgi:hypothetical protein
VNSWDRRYDRDERQQRNYEGEAELSQLVETLVMRVPLSTALDVLAPILASVSRPDREVGSFVLGLLHAEDREPNTAHFWSLWQAFADCIKRSNWVKHLEDKHSYGTELISAMFLRTRWKEGVRHWRSLEGYAERVHALFEDLPASPILTEDYLHFLYEIGERSLPDAFVRIVRRLRTGDPKHLLSSRNSVFMLEVLLQRHVYTRPLELKRDHSIRDSILELLDILVEKGSSAAFRMRDDFVTPLAQ